jgi:hypothetical protein
MIIYNIYLKLYIYIKIILLIINNNNKMNKFKDIKQTLSTYKTKYKINKPSDIFNLEINYALVYVFLFIFFIISSNFFNLVSYYFIVLYPGYLTMNLVICNKFDIKDYHIENRETDDDNIIVDKLLTNKKIMYYNHILCYWLIFSLLFFLEHFLFIFNFFIPFYSLFKVIFIIWYLCGGNYERKINIFYDFMVTPIYQYILNMKDEFKIKRP